MNTSLSDADRQLLPEAGGDPRERRRKLLILGLILVAVSLLHFTTSTQGHWPHALHVFFRKLYFLPIVAGAVWFGMRGALGVSAAVIAVYIVHVRLNWAPEPFERIDQVGEMASFAVLAVVSGALVALEQLARARAERARRNAERERIGTAVAALTETLGARDPTTLEHSKRVARLAEDFALYLGLPRAEARSLYLAGMVHDIGKIGVRDDVLLKPETLGPEERRKIMEHPKIAEKILAPVGFEKVVRYVAAHHESVDGSGYPEGLEGDDIPLPARVLAIADTYDALRHARPYKSSLSEEAVRRTMSEMAGTKLDGRLLDRFSAYLDALGAASPPPPADSERTRGDAPWSSDRGT
ncbi:MAG: hypothetical protein Kow0092_06670 [Deferrisomatales bacterium]